ncbi:MAG: PIN domain-containing protein [Saprospiraceae bacterium]|nr:PIN domain-containing protein [Saprospiraceae bacterium]MCB9343377.1 PIN domain-containing protein [Lewinellaceae bacterium]
MKKVFVDTDVLIDFLTNRDPHSLNSMKVMEYGYRKIIEIYISSLCLSNIHYLVSRIEGKAIAREKIKSLLKITDVLSVNKLIVEKAAYSEFKDFEDGIQYYCAEENQIEFILTRNVKDFSKSKLPVQTPTEFLAAL